METPKLDKLYVAGMLVNTSKKETVLEVIRQRLRASEKTFMVTPYSEFLYASLHDPKVMELLNSADVSIPDGIGVILAHKFLGLPQHFKNRFWRWLEAWWQMFRLGLLLLVNPQAVYGPFSGKIVGADIVWDLARLAQEENKSVYILGGFGNTPVIAAQKLVEKYPGLRIAGTSSKMRKDPTMLAEVQAAKPDLLLVGFGPIIQEQWIKDNWDQLPIQLAIGLGGTFDYIAGAKKLPPRWVRNIGLEWLYRLVTQPERAGRIKNATYGLVTTLIRLKITQP